MYRQQQNAGTTAAGQLMTTTIIGVAIATVIALSVAGLMLYARKRKSTKQEAVFVNNNTFILDQTINVASDDTQVMSHMTTMPLAKQSAQSKVYGHSSQSRVNHLIIRAHQDLSDGDKMLQVREAVLDADYDLLADVALGDSNDENEVDEE